MLANNEDPDQTPCSVAFDLGLHCLLMSQKWDPGLIWVKATATHRRTGRQANVIELCIFFLIFIDNSENYLQDRIHVRQKIYMYVCFRFQL